MLRLTKFIITLPVLSLPLLGLAPKLHAEAAMTQMDALRLLAKSRAADGKCRILAPGEAEEMSGYLARAEVAASARHSISEIQSTISVGKVLGSSAACSEATSREVDATLAAARRAMAAVKRSRAKRANEDDAAVVNPVPLRKAGERQPEIPRRGGLASYGRQAFAYYVERRCEYLSRREIRAFWVAVVREHRAALKVFGGAAVAAMVRRARAQADAMDCGPRGRQLVMAEYNSLARN